MVVCLGFELTRHRYEMLAEPQRDITPEQAAKRLRECGGELYRKNL